MSYPSQPGFVINSTVQQPGVYPQQGGGYPPMQQQPQQYYPQQGYPQHQNTYPPPAYQHQPFPGPIQQQPGGYGRGQPVQAWSANTDLLNYLRSATSFHVKQKVELLEALVGWETENKYTVKDQNGNKVFYVGEQTECLNRMCCGKRRPITLAVKDMRGMDVLMMERPLDCSCCFGLLLPDSLTVNTVSGQKLGSVVERFNILNPTFDIRDAGDNTVLKIEGPICPIAFNCAGVVFRVTTPNGISVGTISKEWSGFVRELFTDADYFSMSFPIDLDPAVKAVCLGALFLIDYEYFERGGGDHQQGGRRLFG